MDEEIEEIAKRFGDTDQQRMSKALCIIADSFIEISDTLREIKDKMK